MRELRNIVIVAILFSVLLVNTAFLTYFYKKVNEIDKKLETTQQRTTVAGFDAEDLEIKLLTGQLKLIKGDNYQ